MAEGTAKFSLLNSVNYFKFYFINHMRQAQNKSIKSKFIKD